VEVTPTVGLPLPRVRARDDRQLLGRQPSSARLPNTTVDVVVGTTRDIEFVADTPGDWIFMSGQGPFGAIEMGGMFTIIKVRDGLTSYDDLGFYQHPAGTLARKVTLDEKK
jgi:hypothetical protein